MKIVISANEAWNIYNYRFFFVKKLIELDYEVIIFAKKDNYSQYLEQIGCKSYHIDFASSKINILLNFIIIIKFLIFFIVQKPDFYFSFTIKPNIFGSFISNLLGIKTYNTITGLGTYSFAGYFKKRMITIFYKIALSKSNKVIFQNINDNKFFIENKICNHNNSMIINTIGLNLNKYRDLKLIKNLDTINVLYVGRLLYDKGLKELTDAIKVLKKEKYKINLHCVGHKYSDNISQIPERIIDQWIEEKIIIYYGFRDNLKELYEMSHCVILPSYREGFPRVLMEASAYGRPILASNVPGCNDIVKNNYNGFIFEKKSSNSIRDAIKKFINLEYEEKIKLCTNAKKYAENNFDQAKQVNKYLNLIMYEKK